MTVAGEHLPGFGDAGTGVERVKSRLHEGFTLLPGSLKV